MATANAEVSVYPLVPVAGERVAITGGGRWGDTCVPKNPQFSRIDTTLYFDFKWADEYPGAGCFAATSGFGHVVEFDSLSAGTYTVIVRVDEAVVDQQTFYVEAPSHLEPLLLPAYSSRPIIGVDGSRYRTILRLNGNGLRYYPAHGQSGFVEGSLDGGPPIVLTEGFEPPFFPTFGRVLYADKGDLSRVALTLSLGSTPPGGTPRDERWQQLPIVRRSAMSRSFSILNIPLHGSDARYRLRLYRLGSPEPGQARITFEYHGQRTRFAAKLVDVASRQGADKSYPFFYDLDVTEHLGQFLQRDDPETMLKMNVEGLDLGLYWGFITATDNLTHVVDVFHP